MNVRGWSRRAFLEHAARAGALGAVGLLTPWPALAQGVAARVASQPLADKGFAAIRKIGEGVYATISDRSQGLQTRSNGGFIVGRDSAVVLEGFQTTVGAAFQLETLRQVTNGPVQAAINSHWHFDHTLGNAVYGGHGIPIWAHAKAASRMTEYYAKWQTQSLEAFLAPWQKRVREAKTASSRQHAESDIEGLSGMFEPVSQTVLALPNHPLDPAKLPLTIDLGGLKIVIESYVGHTDTDLTISVPDQKIVFTGDLLALGQYPTNINGYPTQWRAVLAKFAAFDRDTMFVPGHGPVTGVDGIALMREVFDDIAGQAEKLYKAGVPAAVAVERYVVPDKWKGYRQFSWGFTIGRTIQQLYAEWSKKPVTTLNY